MKPAITTACCALAICSLEAQDRLRTMPGYEQYRTVAPQIAGSWTSGAVVPRWDADSQAFSYASAGKTYRFDLASLSPMNVPSATSAGPTDAGATNPGRQAAAGGRGARGAQPGAAGQAPFGRRGAVPQNGGQTEATVPAVGCAAVSVARGRQADCAVSPDRRLKAFYRDHNLWVADFDGSNERAVTTDGSDKARVKYGTASWVYGEELGQTTAIWWSPDSTKLGFYRFDESQVKDFYVSIGQTEIQDALDVEAYPKAGAPNPIADVLVYDIAGARTTKLNVRDGKPFDNAVLGHYVYNIHWRPDSREIVLNRANRRQQVLELDVCSVTTAACRAIVHEEWLTGWLNTDTDPRTSPSPSPRWLADGNRFIWESERNGWRNYYLYDVTGRLIAPLTSNVFEASGIVKIDEASGVMFYLARDGDTYLKQQLHRVGLDGKGDTRLTDPQFTHSVGQCTSPAAAGCGISPNNQYIVDVYQRHDQPPVSQLLNASGRAVAQIAKGDLSKYDQLGFKKAEQFTYKAADGQTTLYGQISFPSHFDPSKTYPTLVPVYGGPVLVSNVASENFLAPNPLCEYGFLVVTVSYRGVPGTGKRGADALYLKLGQTEMDDMAAGIKALWDRTYFDKTRVGIYGSSYGGYTAAMELMRHPDVFSAASASSAPTDWRNYDSIYTERYMWLPDENRAGYDAGSVMNHVGNLRGRLLLYYGTADNNVHPNNSLQLVKALQQNGKSFELQVGPDEPHSAVNVQRMMEFFIENLVMRPGSASSKPAR